MPRFLNLKEECAKLLRTSAMLKQCVFVDPVPQAQIHTSSRISSEHALVGLLISFPELAVVIPDKYEALLLTPSDHLRSFHLLTLK